MKGLRWETTPIGLPPAADLERLATVRAGGVAPALRDAFLASEAAADRLDDLFADGAICVTTGQQPGLLTGPLYTLYKGLSAVALARRCERLLDRPVVPVFWVAGDDHDFAEANHIHLLTTDNEVEQLTLRERAEDAPLTPLYREPVGSEIAAVLASVEAHTPETEFQPDIMAWLGRHYTPGTDLATAFAGAVAELLGPFGLVVFRPTHPAAKRAAAPVVLQALERAEDLDARLSARAEELRQADRPVPVHVGDQAAPVMLEASLGRDRLVRSDDGFVTRRSGERFTLSELRAIADAHSERLSPNVLLRPAVEAALLPTLAYVAGPGELAYLPQCDPIYAVLGIEPQRPLPRWSGRVIEGRVQKVLDKYQIDADDLDAPEGQLERSLVQEEMPAPARDALRILRETIDREYDRLADAAVGVDPTLKKPVASSRHQALKSTDDVEKRIVSHLKQQNEILMQQLAKARHNLFPLGRPQERVFTAAPYLIRYGHGFLERTLDAAASWMDALEPASTGP